MPRSVVSNPPYNMPWTPPALAGFIEPYAGLPIPPKGNANYAFILQALHKLSDNGKAALLLPASALDPTSAAEKTILKKIVVSNLLSAVIQLPENMFASTSIGACILLFDAKKETQKVTFFDLREHADQEVREQRGQTGGASHTGRVYKSSFNVISRATMERVVKAINDRTTEPGFCTTAALEDVKEKEFVLAPIRYMDYVSKVKRRSYEDICADYNKFVRQRNAVHVKFNRTAARRLGYDCLEEKDIDLTPQFALVGQVPEKENHVSFTNSDGITISTSTKEDVHPLILQFLNNWEFLIIHTNNEQNRILAELRDALAEDLLTGKIDVSQLPDLGEEAR